MSKSKPKPNKLINSQSPYLLQHAYNPVSWLPWDTEAFEKAKKENKPIFLSIGYSTCHWCHVMEHESFEDFTVAELMNKNFINIKVDREEMPEIDHLYMSVCQAMTGSGGWPLTIIMTPNKEPFFAGTYFPKVGRSNRPGMLQLIPSLANAWESKQDQIQTSINKIQDYLIRINTNNQGDDWEETIIRDAFSQYASRYDPDYGGFSKAPKFPSPHNLIFLLRYGKLYNENTSISMVKKTLSKMRLGGIFDHIGLGFHRYSTDKRWLLPHFEKMLYDQALIAMAYIEAYQLTGSSEYKTVAKEIFTYILRDMTDNNGGFFSAEDADSEGEEGTFYIWTQEELIETLGEKDGKIMSHIYNFKNIGNFHDEATGQLTGKNIPYFSVEKNLIAKSLDISINELDAFIESSRKKLFLQREHRTHPMRDNKILTDWNGLMIAALSLAGGVFSDDLYLEAAKNSAKYILKSHIDKNGRLMKRSRLGKAGINPIVDDYAFMVWGLLNLYEATSEVNFLKSAINLTEIMIEDFIDENGGFFIGSIYSEKLLVRAKNSHDGAVPSGNSVAVMNLFRIGRITGNNKWTEIANSTLRAFKEQAQNSPMGFSHMISGFMFDFKDPKEIVIVTNKNNNNTREILKKLQLSYIPNTIIIYKNISDKNKIDELAPWIKDHQPLGDKVTFYVCRNRTCKQPTTNLDIAIKYLNEKSNIN